MHYIIPIKSLPISTNMLSKEKFNRLLNVIPHNQGWQSPVKGLWIHHSDRPFTYESVVQEPSICIVLKGEREVQLGEQCYVFNNEHFMFCPVNVPMRGEIKKASEAEPFVVVSMKIDQQMVREILLKQTAIFAKKSANSTAYFGQWQLDSALKEAFERLLLLHETPNDIDFLAPLIQQEIYYRLLTGSQGGKLKEMVSQGSHTQQIAQATDYIQQHFRETIVVEELATHCGMSVSSFHSYFKRITSLSPLQYQKAFRLTTAKGLIAQGTDTIANIAYQVGYESPSQFSREFKRYFGNSPKADLLV